MGTFLLLLLIFFVIVPLVRGAVAVYRARRAARKFFDQFRNPGAESRSAAPEQPQPKAKKINPEDGEFVAFEDLPVYGSSEQESCAADVKPESQVVDVEWEDIKIN